MTGRLGDALRVMRCVAFIGTSLSGDEAAGVFGGEIRPPIRRGDLDGVVAEAESAGTDLAVGIVDGEFLQRPAITPKEVVRALDAGVRVYGASSMGALRAAECASAGMIGVGRIYELYASGAIDADDEVALVFSPDMPGAASYPLVNARVALGEAVRRSLLTEAEAADALDAYRAVYFPQRTEGQLRRVVEHVVAPDRRDNVVRFLAEDAPDQKRIDASELLSRLEDLRHSRSRSGHDSSRAPARA